MKLSLLSTAFSLAFLFAFTTADVSLGPFPDVVYVGGTYTLSWVGSAKYLYSLWLVIVTEAENSYAWRKVFTLAEDLQFSSLNGNYTWTIPSNISTLGEFSLLLQGLTVPFNGTNVSNMTQYFAISSSPAPASSTSASLTPSATSSTTSSATSSGIFSAPSGAASSGTSSSTHLNSLSGGAIAGIVVGILVLLTLVAIGAVAYRRRRRVLALREREAAARGDRLAPVMHEGYPSYQMQRTKRDNPNKETVA